MHEIAKSAALGSLASIVVEVLENTKMPAMR
jgi:hypothetical protein